MVSVEVDMPREKEHLASEGRSQTVDPHGSQCKRGKIIATVKRLFFTLSGIIG